MQLQHKVQVYLITTLADKKILRILSYDWTVSGKFGKLAIFWAKLMSFTLFSFNGNRNIGQEVANIFSKGAKRFIML